MSIELACRRINGVMIMNEAIIAKDNTILADHEGEYKRFTGFVDWGQTHGEVSNATFELEYNQYNTKSMMFKHGTWVSGQARNADWLNGTWLDGDLMESHWHHGNWKNGRCLAVEWIDGNFVNGVFDKGTWNGGIWCNGIMTSTYWKGGLWKNGEWGTQDSIDFSYWDDGLWLGGTWYSGVWLGGKWMGGTWLGGMDVKLKFHENNPREWQEC